MQIAEVLVPRVVTIGPDHTLSQAAGVMADHDVGAAVVLDPDGEGPGILTERDVLRAVAQGRDPTTTPVRDCQTSDLTTAVPTSDLRHAGQVMLSGGFRHLVVVDDGGEVVGVLSIRDVLRSLLG